MSHSSPIRHVSLAPVQSHDKSTGEAELGEEVCWMKVCPLFCLFAVLEKEIWVHNSMVGELGFQRWAVSMILASDVLERRLILDCVS